MVVFGRSQLRIEDFGPFRMPGAMGIAANIISVVWMIVVMIFSTFSLTLPVTAQSMNYSIVVVAGWSMFGLVYYLWAARHKFQVPLTNLSVTLDTSKSMNREKRENSISAFPPSYVDTGRLIVYY